MGRVTDELVRVTGRDLPTVVRMSAIWYAKSVIKKTPIAPKVITRNFIFLSAAQSPTGVATRIPASPFKFKPKGRGFAKSGWVKSLRGLGTGGADSKLAWGKAWQFSGFVNALRKFAQPHVQMTNSIPYIETLNKKGNARGTGRNFFDEAMGTTIRRMSRLLEFHAKKIDRAWKRVLF